MDTNVLVDVFTDDDRWRPWSERSLRDALLRGPVSINQLVYAEVSMALDDAAILDRELDALFITRLDLPYAAGFGAGRAFLQYRRAGGARSAPLPDFYIGAHAVEAGLMLLTRDAARYRTYFPTLELIAP